VATRPTGNPDQFAHAHRALLADHDIQFDLAIFRMPRPPVWLDGLIRFLAGLAPGLRILFWIVVAIVALVIVYAMFRWLQGLDIRPWRRTDRAAIEAGWRPDEAPARALLGEADALAASGDYGGAAHLLLHRSIEELDRNRPHLVQPALTSRDLAGAPALPPGPRTAFRRIVMAVETSLFGGRSLGEQDWRDCRSSYEEFAFSAEWSR
jgi:hypothetical protein